MPESLQEQASSLAQAVSVFKLDGLGYSQPAERPLMNKKTRKMLKAKPTEMSAPAARSNKLAAAHNSDGEWEEF